MLCYKKCKKLQTLGWTWWEGRTSWGEGIGSVNLKLRVFAGPPMSYLNSGNPVWLKASSSDKCRVLHWKSISKDTWELQPLCDWVAYLSQSPESPNLKEPWVNMVNPIAAIGNESKHRMEIQTDTTGSQKAEAGGLQTSGYPGLWSEIRVGLGNWMRLQPRVINACYGWDIALIGKVLVQHALSPPGLVPRNI